MGEPVSKNKPVSKTRKYNIKEKNPIAESERIKSIDQKNKLAQLKEQSKRLGTYKNK
jgi:hypothetical protein